MIKTDINKGISGLEDVFSSGVGGDENGAVVGAGFLGYRIFLARCGCA